MIFRERIKLHYDRLVVSDVELTPGDVVLTDRGWRRVSSGALTAGCFGRFYEVHKLSWRDSLRLTLGLEKDGLCFYN